LDDGVQEKYKAKHFPPSYFKKLKASQAATLPGSSSTAPTAPAAAPKPQDPNPSNASATVPNTAHHSLHGLSAPLQTLINSYSTTSILGEQAPTDLSPAPPCPISSIPEEIIVEILEHLAVKDLASFVRLAQVCKRLAYLVTTEDRVWKRVALGREYGFADMHYTYSCRVDGKPLGDDDEGGLILGTSNLSLSDTEDDISPTPEPPSPASLTQLLVPSIYPTYRTLFRQRPRIRFNGCYISTVNYTRPGQASPTSSTWGSPIHIVTYFRYLRFLRDGTCISLLTTSEPSDVVPYLFVEHMHRNHGALPSSAMKDAVLGRWRMSGPEIPGSEDGEREGSLLIETAGATPKYLYKMALSFGNAGRGAKHNKLSWQGYWSYNRLTDDWGEFGLKNDRPYYWSRVRSYGMGWGEAGMKK
jgi:F-box protein 9